MKRNSKNPVIPHTRLHRQMNEAQSEIGADFSTRSPPKSAHETPSVDRGHARTEDVSPNRTVAPSCRGSDETAGGQVEPSPKTLVC
jgi:hypothetical protein